MTDTGPATALIGGIGLLERAVSYALGSLHMITSQALSHPTPCADWDLRTLLVHLDDSFVALYEAADVGWVADLAAPAVPAGPVAPGLAGEGAGDPVGAVRDRACQLVGAWANASMQDQLIAVLGSPLTAGIVTGAGAIEAAVHGWDIARACGRHHPIPLSLAEEMLELAPLLIGEADRPARFAAAVEVSPSAGAEARLLTFLGRQPC